MGGLRKKNNMTTDKLKESLNHAEKCMQSLRASSSDANMLTGDVILGLLRTAAQLKLDIQRVVICMDFDNQETK